MPTDPPSTAALTPHTWGGYLPRLERMSMLTVLLGLLLTTAQAAPPGDPVSGSPAPVDARPVPAAPAPAPDPCRAPPPDAEAPFDAQLDQAKRLYRSGCHSWALAYLTSLDVRRRLEDLPSELDIDTRMYLGEVFFMLDRREDARDTFEALVVQHPTAQMGMLEHDPDVVDLFVAVKAEVVARTVDAPELRIPRRPVVTWLPFGVAHFRAGDHGRGLAWGGGQLTCLGGAVATWAVGRNRFPGPVEEFELGAANLLHAVNLTANACFFALWIGSQADAELRWRQRQKELLGVAPGVLVDARGAWGPRLELRTRF